MSKQVSGRSSGVVIWHSPCAHPAVPLALEGSWGWASGLGPAASLKVRAHGRCAEGSRAQSFQIVGICRTHCVQAPVVSPCRTQWTKGQVPIPLGFPFSQERENGDGDSSGEARVRRTGAVGWWAWMGSAGKVWVERLTFEQRPEQAGLSGGGGGGRAQEACAWKPQAGVRPLCLRSRQRARGAWVDCHVVFCDPEFLYESAIFKRMTNLL